jgi:competence protein ComEC
VRDTYVNLRVEADTLLIEGAQSAISIKGPVLVQVPRFPAFNYGDRIRAHGILQSPPEFEDFSYTDYLARQGIYSILRRATATPISNSLNPPNRILSFELTLFHPLYALKARALTAIAQTFPEPQGSLLSGILLGVETGIPDSLKDAFRKTGTSHIVAISGFNISIIAKIFASLFSRVLGQRRSVPVTIVAIGVYTLLAGADASVVRAALMGSLVLLSDGFNRPSSGLASLATAVFVMTLYNPGTFYDVGFQLSVAATLGLIVYAEPFTNFALTTLAKITKPETATQLINTFGEFSLLTIAAQVTTLPLIAFYFHQISIISLVANLIVLPVQPAVMVLGGLAALGAMLHSALGYLLFWLAWPFVTFTIVVVEGLAQVPLAAIQINRLPLWFLFLAYGALIGCSWFAMRPKIQRPNGWPLVTSLLSVGGLVMASIGTLAGWNMYLHQPDGKLHVTFFDVGDGDAVLIQTPTGRYALIDGGPSPNTLAESLGRVLPVGARTLDLVVTASPDSKSLGGLPGLFDRITIGQVVLTGGEGRGSAYREWADGLASRAITQIDPVAGLRFDLGQSAVLSIIATTETGSLVRVDYGKASFLFPIGLDGPTATQLALAGQVAPATVLLSRGEAESLSALFMDAAQPQAVVLAIGQGRQPDELLSDLFAERTVLRTDERGTITFATDGEQLWVEAER